MEECLICRDSKGKCRVINISYEKVDNGYVIKRSSGIFDGKFINQPELYITKGKVKRTVLEQTELEYNSIIKKYLDKGYKKTSDLGIFELTQQEIDNKLPKQNTDQAGVIKPQLCKVLDREDPKQTDKEYFASFKLDGVRCLLYYKDGEIHTASRGGQDYDIPTTYIRHDSELIKLFENNPSLILDGEIYRHGWPLSKISGLCRKEELVEDHKELMFWCYDFVDETLIFRARAKQLIRFGNQYTGTKCLFLQHYIVRNLDEIMAFHNRAVSDGYEGCVLRDPTKVYKPGSRNCMQKVKLFTDDEFKILGLVEGLREEDMCFLLETKEHNQFKAKPIGTRDEKQWYREHINELIGKLATVKYFGFTNTDHPVPNLPVLKSIRIEKDIDD